MPPYRIAQLSHEQLKAIEGLENQLGITLVAYEPSAGESTDGRAESMDAETDLVMDALVDTYRTYDPHFLV